MLNVATTQYSFNIPEMYVGTGLTFTGLATAGGPLRFNATDHTVLDNAGTVGLADTTLNEIQWTGITWSKQTPLLPMVLDYSFQLPTDIQLMGAERSVNYRLGNLTMTTNNRQLSTGTFYSVPQLNREGEAVYICSNSLSSHTGVLPSGLKSALCRIPVAPYGEVTDVQTQSLSQGYTEVGGLSLKTIRVSLRDRNGLPLDMGDGNWSAQTGL